MHDKSVRRTVAVLLLWSVITAAAYAQTFTVKGNVSTATAPVRFASVTFVDNNDSTRRFTALTDTAGNYQLGIITSARKARGLPTQFELQQNYPNPFVVFTSIPYKLAGQSDISIRIFNILGQLVKDFKLGTQYSGSHSIVWDGRDDLGRGVAPGVYFYQLVTAKTIQAQKMLFGWGSGADQVFLDKLGLNYTRSSSIESRLLSTKDGALSSLSKTYAVQIINTDSTKPLILRARFDCALSQQDTTLNFNVDNFDLSLCYSKPDSMLQPNGEYYLTWEIHLNNIGGTNSKNFTNWNLDCDGPAWSPDGKYIAFNREKVIGSDLFLYDVYRDSLIAFLPSDTCGYAGGVWTLDSKKIIYCRQSNTTGKLGYHIIDLDRKNDRQLKYPVNYFYPDGYNTLYVGIDNVSCPTVYHSNLDGTTNELIVDVGRFVSTVNGSGGLYGFDPIDNVLLLSFDDPSTTLPNCIAKYDITQRRLDTIAVSDSGWKCYKPGFSSDFKKVAMTEVHIADTINYTNRISMIDLEKETKTTLIEFPGRDQTGKFQCIDWNRFAFSKDDKYFAFVKDVFQNTPSQFVWWISYLYVVELDTKQVTYIDNGISPLWNPSMPH